MKFLALKSLFLMPVLAVPACSGSESPKAERTPAERIRVSVETVSGSSLPLFFESVGTVRAKASATIAARMLGQIRQVHVSEGDRIRQGQILVEIDAREPGTLLQKAQAGQSEVEGAVLEVEKAIEAAQSGRDAARANADLANVTYQRFQNLLERKSVSQQEFDQAEARHRVVTAELQRAEAMLASLQQKRSQVLAQEGQVNAGLAQAEILFSYTKLEAPFSGIVTRRHVDPGDLAAPGVPLLAVENDRAYRLEAAVPESRLPSIQVSQSVPVHLPALDLKLEGRVSEIVPEMDPATRTATVKIDLEGHPGVLSGMFGRAAFPIGERKALSVPEAAVFLRGQLSGVYVIDAAGVAHFRLVKTGKHFGDRVEILSGLKEQERVVTGRHPRLQEGVHIEG